jgi:hypothetical protein
MTDQKNGSCCSTEGSCHSDAVTEARGGGRDRHLTGLGDGRDRGDATQRGYLL